MSPLFGAAFLWLVAAILWWSGWREEATDDVPGWAVGLFLAVWPLAWLGKVPLAGSLSINGASVWTLFSVALVSWRLPAARGWTAVCGGLLIGSVAVLAGKLAYIPSGFAPAGSSWAIAALIGWLAALLLRAASEQALAVTVCLFLIAVAHAFARSQTAELPAAMPDEGLLAWWIAVFSARIWTGLARAVGAWARKAAVKTGGR